MVRNIWNKMDLAGKVFSGLRVLRENGRDKNRKVIWRCCCECGNETDVVTEKLRSGNTKSCGCRGRKKLIERNTKHGLSDKPEYGVWKDIKKRCYNKNSTYYHNYGERGISVSHEWLDDFERFYRDMGSRPSSSHEIDRIDNNGSYSVENCRWVTRSENQRNTRNSMIWTVYGIKYKTMQEAANVYGVNHVTIRNWCLGYSTHGGKYKYAKKPGCHAEKKYDRA